MAMQKTEKWAVTIRDMTQIGMMAAVMEASKLALSFLPNVELVSFWLILFTLFFGGKIVYAVFVFILLEGCLYGFGLWWFMYAYVWVLLVLAAWCFRANTGRLFWSFLSGSFGLMFGALCSLTYLVMGTAQAGPAQGISMAVSWWIGGIPWDIIHGISNFVLMAVLYTPVNEVMKKIKRGL